MLKISVNAFFRSLFVSAILIFSANMINAQDNIQNEEQQEQNDTKANASQELAQDLSAKLNLNEAQTNQIKDILVSYQDDVQGAVQNDPTRTDLTDEQTTTNTAISEVLDETQKAAFDNVKAEWWASVNSKINTASKIEQKNDNDTY
ncbi:MAG: hypothetical protein ABI550_06440 [Ignavibacteriaceae bacterium]